MQKKILKNLLLVVVMAVLCVAVGMTASAERAIVDSGECGAEGDNVIWTLYDDGELVISGEGEMKDYGEIYEDGHSIGYGPWADRAKTVIVNDKVTKIGIGAFSRCKKLNNVFIGSGVNKIGDLAFYECFNLTNISVNESNEFFSSDSFGVLFNKDKTEIIQYPIGNEITSYIIPDSVNYIYKRAFYYASNLTEIYIPDNITIDEEAFWMCFRLNKILFPSKTTNINIGLGAFALCWSLENIEIPAGVTLQECAFMESVGIIEVYISKDVKIIGAGTFSYAIFLDKIYIEGMTTELGDYSLGATLMIVSELTRDEFIEAYIKAETTTGEISDYYEDIIDNAITYTDDIVHTATIYCHAGSTAEAYAIENGADYVLTHFYEGEWTYDYDNMIRYRKCIHCDELETEVLETTSDSDVEIIEPVNPDTDFVVEEITDYVIIEEALSNGVAGDFEIVRAFDITMTGKDGVHVQPDGTVKVKLPLDWEKDGVYKVYRVNDDGTLTDMNAYREGSHMVFDTDHFSIYVIVDESEKADAPVLPDEPQEETKDTLFTRLFEFIKAFFALITSFFKK